jgi:hypothetical protein
MMDDAKRRRAERLERTRRLRFRRRFCKWWRVEKWIDAAA